MDNNRKKLMSNLAIGRRVFELRKERGYTQVQLATRLGIERKSIGRLENGESLLKTEVIMGIAEELHTSTEYILTGKR